jgi:hypothetical protein
MNMGMESQLLTPGVQDAEETDFRAQVCGIASELEKGFRTGAEQ